MKLNEFKICFVVFFLFLTLLSLPVFLEARLKVGVVLSGGGARGIAHVGTLQRLKELHVPIDYIGGTSFGALVASFYAAGYSPKQIETIISKFNWQDAFRRNNGRLTYYYFERKRQKANLIKVRFKDWKLKLPNAISSSQVIINELLYYFTRSNYISQKNFLDLKTPLLISASDIVNGKNKIFKQGDLIKVLQASLSVPFLFPPVTIDSTLYVDGGITNNLPIKAMKSMGADFIIASNTTNFLSDKSELDSALNIADQLINIMMFSKIEDELKQADVIIRPDVEHIDNTQFFRCQELLDKGRDIPAKTIVSLKKLRGMKRNTNLKKTHTIDPSKIEFIGNKNFSRSELIRALPQDKNVSKDSLDDLIIAEYIDAGYVLAEIDTIYWKDDRLQVKINPGLVQDIKIQGNKITKFYVINREIKTKSGQIFNINKVISDVKRVYSTNYFKTVSYSIDREPQGKVNIIFQVEEKPFGFIRAGVNYNTEKSSSAFLSVGFDNFLGNGNLIDLYTHFGEKRKFGFSFKDDRIFDTNLNFSIDSYYQDDLSLDKGREWNLNSSLGIFDDRRLGVFSAITDCRISYLDEESRTIGLGVEGTFDSFDQFPYPKQGLFRKVSYKNFSTRIGSQYDFQNFYLKNNIFVTPLNNFTLSLNLLINLNSSKSDKVPSTRKLIQRPSNTFFGFHDNEVTGEDLFYFFPKLRIHLKEFSLNDPRKDLYFFAKSGIGDFGQINDIDKIWEVFRKSKKWGYSLGIEVSTIAGPVILSYEGRKNNNYWFFSIGYDF